MLRLYSPQPRDFTDGDIVVARAVASQCAVAITNAKLYTEAIEAQRFAEQMRLAGLIQRRMIPEKPPQIKGLDIAATYIPCFDVGGDFYDFLPIDKDRLVITIADVIGKGVPAAIMMSWFRGAVQAYTEGFRDVLRRRRRDGGRPQQRPEEPSSARETPSRTSTRWPAWSAGTASSSRCTTRRSTRPRRR